MQDFKAKIEELNAQADDCESIAKLAIDERKRGLFNRLAISLRSMAEDLNKHLRASGQDRQ